MEKLSHHVDAALPEPMTRRLVWTDGQCSQHGPSRILIHAQHSQWQCPTCFEVELEAKARREWVDERIAHLQAHTHIPAKYREQRFIASTEKQKAVRSLVMAFRDSIVQKNDWAALILTGDNGTGKTLLACEFARTYILKHLRSVRYTTTHGMIADIQASYSQPDKSEESEIARYAQYDLLILDEVDVKRDKPNAQLLLSEVIGRRYANGKPVIVISNQGFDLLEAFLGKRVHDRLHENAVICNFDWPSYRRDPSITRPLGN
ncbi:MAG: hypothetical protein RL748_3813 [Pseudomonadota bacterium]|jgi:DNA replication protein DnaC